MYHDASCKINPYNNGPKKKRKSVYLAGLATPCLHLSTAARLPLMHAAEDSARPAN